MCLHYIVSSLGTSRTVFLKLLVVGILERYGRVCQKGVNGSDVFLLVRGPISWFDPPLSAILAMTVEDTG